MNEMNMKMKNIYKKIAFVLAAVLSVMVSCTKGPDDGGMSNGDPNFPEMGTFEVLPGNTYTLQFKPNYDWELTIPVESRQWFWFKDGSVSVRRLTGKASESPVTVEVCVTDYDEFDTVHSCEVSMAMAGQSQVVAKYTLGAKEREFSVLAAMWESDTLKLTEPVGEDAVRYYIYPDTEISAVDFRWSPADADFRAPLQIAANCEWDVEKPEWLELNVPETTAGVVELVMTGETLEETSGKVIFKSGDLVMREIDVTIPSCNDLQVYAAQIEEGDLVYGDDGYVYAETPSSEIDVVWLGADFRMPVKVDSKCSWTLEYPEWLSVDTPEKTTGEVHLTLLGVPSAYPLDETSGKIAFSKDGVVLEELDVKFPGCKNILEYSIAMSLTSLEYSYDGLVKTSVGYEEVVISGNVLGVRDTRIFVVETTGGVVGAENPSWFKMDLSSWNSASGSPVIQERTMTFSVADNAGDERSAVLFVLPSDVTAAVSDLFNPDMTVKDEYAAWAVPVVQSSENYSEYLTIAEVEEPSYTFERASEEKTSELASLFGDTEFVYVLTYNDVYACDDAALTMAIPFTSYKVFGSEDTSADKSSDSSFWLQYVNYNDNNNSGVVRMYLNMTLPTESSEGYVVYYDSYGNVLAIVECVSPFKEEEIITPPDPGEDDDLLKDEYGNKYEENDSYFNSKSAAKAAGAVMYECKAGPYFDQYREFGCPVMILEYTSADTELEIKLPSTVSYWSVMPYPYRSYITLNGSTVDRTQGIMTSAVNKVKIKMSSEVYDNKEEIEADDDYGRGLKLTLHKDMSTQDPTLVIFCRLNL